MNRSLKALAVAVAFAGALGATAAQASAANFNVNFGIKNADASASMIRVTNPLPNGVSGLIAPPAAISAGGNDPATGHALWTDALPGPGASKQVSVTYANALNETLNQCTFTMKVQNIGGSLPYQLSFSVNNSACSAPASVRTSDGQFTSQTYLFGWAT